MATLNELERVAAMAHGLRPDWRYDSLVTHLRANHGTKPYRDLAVAMAWIAADPDTKTPARLLENGPWWAATTPREAGAAGTTNHKPCDRCRYPHPASVPCDVRKTDIDRDSPTRQEAIQQARAAALAAAHGGTEPKQENHQ